LQEHYVSKNTFSLDTKSDASIEQNETITGLVSQEEFITDACKLNE